MSKREIVLRMDALGYSVYQISQVVDWPEVKVVRTLRRD